MQPRDLLSVRVLTLVPRVRVRLLGLIALTLMIMATYVAQGALVALVLSTIFNGGAVTTVVPLIAGVGGLAVLRAVLITAREVLATEAAGVAKQAVRQALVARMFDLGPGWLQHTRTGSVRATVVDGVEQLDPYVGKYLPQIVATVLGAAGVTAYVVLLDPLIGILTLACGLLVPVILPLSRWLTASRIMPWVVAYRKLSADTLDGLQGMTTLTSLGASGRHRQRLAEQARTVTDRMVRLTVIVNAYRGVIGLFIGVGMAVGLGSVQRAARAARADEFISGLPEGYDTSAGEFGSRLSGGQKQRIAIARAILKDAPILVLDEAVSNLDVESEHEVAAAMAGARAGRTTLIVAHRLSTIRSADRIVVLDNGVVAESGTHAELVARRSTYARLIAAQPSETGVIPMTTISASPTVSAADIAQFNALGFVRLAGWLSAEEVDRLRAEAEQALLDGRDRSVVTGKVSRRWTQVALMAKNTPFSMSLLIDDPRFHDAATALLSRAVLPRPAIATRQQGATGWHSAWPEGPIGRRVTFLHYFEPRQAETGALRYLPGTHHLPSFEPFSTYLSEHCDDAAASIDQLGGVTIETMPGDVIAFDSRGLHASRGGKNRLQWNLPYTIDPLNDTERTEYLDVP